MFANGLTKHALGRCLVANMPKAAHRTEEQKVVGYINAAREGLRSAIFYIGNDNPAHDHIKDMIEQTFDVEKEFLESRGVR